MTTVRNEVVKVMFLQASVCPQGGGGVYLSACWDTTPPQEQTPPGADTHPLEHNPREHNPPGADTHTPGADTHPPWEQTHPLPGADTPHPGADTPHPGADTPPAPPPPLRYGHCCGQYTSYWNAFLLLNKLCLIHVRS